MSLSQITLVELLIFRCIEYMNIGVINERRQLIAMNINYSD